MLISVALFANPANARRMTGPGSSGRERASREKTAGRVAQLMRDAGLVGASRRRSGPVTPRRDERARPASDLVDRKFVVDRPNQLWMADISFVQTAAESLYLAVVLDAWSRRIVAMVDGRSSATELVLDALQMAMGQRRPASEVIHHSNPGQPTYLLGVRQPLQRGWRAPVEWVCRRRLRQRRVRELLRYARMRTARPAPLRRARGRRWCSTRTTERSGFSAAPARAASATT